jgi:hypothetical protein
MITRFASGEIAPLVSNPFGTDGTETSPTFSAMTG